MGEQNEPNEQSQVERSEEQVKKAGKDAARAGKKLAGKVARELARAFLKAFGVKGVIVLICVIIIFTFLAAFVFHIDKSVFDGLSSLLGSTSASMNANNGTGTSTGSGTGTSNGTGTYNGNSQNSIGQAKDLVEIQERSIVLNTELFDKNVNQWFQRNGISKKTLGISEDNRELKAFLEAEAATLYPDLRERSVIEAETPIEEGQLQGCVKFYRNYENGNRQLLEYMPYTEYATELAKLGVKLDDEITQEQIYVSGTASRAEVEAQFEKLKDKFTLDKSQNIVIVGLRTDETIVTYSDYAEEEERQYSDGTEYSYYFNIVETRINYQSVIQKYAMPFELCVAFLLTTDNPEYVMEVANLAKNSNIIIDIQDNVETNTYTTVFSHKSTFSLGVTYSYMLRWTEEKDILDEVTGDVIGTEDEEIVKGPYSETYTAEDTVNADNYETIVETIVVPKPVLNLTYADTWLAHIECEYKNEPIDKIETTSISTFGNTETYTNDLSLLSANNALNSGNENTGAGNANLSGLAYTSAISSSENNAQEIDEHSSTGLAAGMSGDQLRMLGQTMGIISSNNNEQTQENENIDDNAVENENLKDDEWMVNVPYYHPTLAYPPESVVKENHSEAEDITLENRITEEKRTDKKIEFKSELVGNSYNLVKKEVKETPEKFLSLLRVDPNNINLLTGEKEFNLYDFKLNTEVIKYRNVYGASVSPESYIYDTKEFFFELISSNSKTQGLEETMDYLLKLYQGKTTYDESRFSLYEPGSFTNTFNYMGGSYLGGIYTSIWGCGISRDEFIEAANNYKLSGNSKNETYHNKMARYAGDIYDICMEYNINPGIAFAWGCYESSYGTDAPDNNFYGMAIYNGQNRGKAYASYQDSTRDFCKWIMNRTSPGSGWDTCVNRSSKYASVNEKFASGDPSNNIYILFGGGNYMDLNTTHLCDEPDFRNPAGDSYYLSHGSTWGAGGRVYIYHMYELGDGGMPYRNQYAELCGHPNASDATTLKERADYAEYCVNKHLLPAKSIFGEKVFAASGGGELNPSSEAHIAGTYTSRAGKEFVIYKQSGSYFPKQCNRAAMACICSGFFNGTPEQLKNKIDSFGNSPNTNERAWNEFGLTYRSMGPTNNSIQSGTIRDQIMSGGYIMIHIGNPRPGTSKYGTVWTAGTNPGYHWVAILDYKQEDGQEKIFVSSSSRGTSGWYNIDEFDGMVRNGNGHILLINPI